MTTDFSYNGKQIVSSGPFKPGGKDMPSDARTRVESYADIANIPNPHVGLKITVKVDETNNNKMTDYIVKSLKANASGIANSVVDQVQRYVDYLGASGGGSVSQEDINTAVNNYLTEHPVSSGATAEQAAQIEANRTAIGDENSGLVKEVNNIKNTELQNLNTAIQTLETLVGVDETLGDKSGLPSGDANVIASINRIDNKTTSGNFSMRNIMDGEIFILSTGTNETYGNIVVSTTSLSFNEDSSSTFTVKLDSAPSNSQTINISVDNENCTVSSSSLTFTSSNYSTEQTITVNGVHSSGDYNNTSSIITLSSDGVSSKEISVILINIDTQKEISSILAVYNQEDTIVYPTTSLDSLKSNLVVTANYSDDTSEIVTGYTLSGTLSVGISIITVTYSGKTTTFNVTVSEKQAITVTGVTLSYNEYEMNVNDTMNLVATIQPSNADNQEVTFSSDNSNVSISQNGLTATITGVAAGNSVITVTTSDGNYNATCNFTINEVVIETPKPLFSYTNLNSSKSLPEEYNSIIADNNNFTLFGRIIKNESSPNRTCAILKTSGSCYRFERTWQSKLSFNFYGTVDASNSYPTDSATSEDDTVVYAFVRNDNNLLIYTNNTLQTNYGIPSGFTFNSVDGMEITIGDDANTLDLYFYNSNLDENQLTSIYNTIYGGE